MSNWPATDQPDVRYCPTCDHLLTVPSRKMFLHDRTYARQPPSVLLLLLIAAVALPLFVAALNLIPSPRPYKQGYDYAKKLLRENPFHDLRSIFEAAAERKQLPNLGKSEMLEYLDGVQDAVQGKDPNPRWYKNR